VARYTFIVWNFHPLLSAGLYRRTNWEVDLKVKNANFKEEKLIHFEICIFHFASCIKD
jgi:hypothetical protein